MSYTLSTLATGLSAGLQATLGFQALDTTGAIVNAFSRTGIRATGISGNYTAGAVTLNDAAVLLQWGEESAPGSGLIGTVLLEQPVQELATASALAAVAANATAIKAKTDTIGSAAVTVIAPAAVTGNAITGLRGDRWVINLTGLGSIAGRSKLWFTVKARVDDADTAAVLQITEADGLVRLLGSATFPAGISAASGSVTVTDATAGDLTLTIEAPVTALLNVGQNFNYDIQVLTGTAVATKVSGSMLLTADVTLATS